MKHSSSRAAAAVTVTAATALLLTLAACNRQPPTDPRLISAWNHTLYGMVRAERVSPPVGSRLVAYATIALYAGLAVDMLELKPLNDVLNGFPELPKPAREERYDATFAAIAAERVVLDSLLREGLPTTRASMARLADSLNAARTAAGVSDVVRRRSQEIGTKIGLAVLSWAHADGFDSTRGRKYVPPVGPGLWKNDAPGNTFASQNASGVSVTIDLGNPANVQKSGNLSDRDLILNRPKSIGSGTMLPVNMSGVTEPYWGQLRPFVLKNWDECQIPAAPAYGPNSTAPLYQEAKVVFDTHKALTPEQKTIAHYWADNAGESGTPSGHWTAIASQMVSERKLSAAAAARVTMLTAVSMADGFIAAWGYKFRFNSIRPRMYIRAVMNSTWEPLISTPPFPEYLPGHSTVSAAAATVMTAMLGAVPFDDSTSVAIGHAVRRFPSFFAAAEEAGMSRIYGGIHFPSSNKAGGALGRCIGDKVVARFGLTPKS